MHGRSLGAAVLCYGAANSLYKPSGYIIENTFTKMEDMAKIFFRPLSIFIRLILRNKWDTIQNIKKLTQPTLFIMCYIKKYFIYFKKLK